MINYDFDFELPDYTPTEIIWNHQQEQKPEEETRSNLGDFDQIMDEIYSAEDPFDQYNPDLYFSEDQQNDQNEQEDSLDERFKNAFKDSGFNPVYIPQTEIDSSVEKYYSKETTGNKSSNYTHNRDYLYNFFKKEYSFTDEQIAGILGVLYSESGLETTAVRTGGKDTGIAQWVGSRRTKAEEMFGKPLKDCSLEEQAEYIKWELTNTHQIVDKLKNAETQEEAVDIWLRGYENGGGGNLISKEKIIETYKKHYPNSKNIYNDFIKTRVRNARKIYNEIINK